MTGKDGVLDQKKKLLCPVSLWENPVCIGNVMDKTYGGDSEGLEKLHAKWAWLLYFLLKFAFLFIFI